MLPDCHILVVDDSEESRLKTCQVLQEHGATVHCVRSRMEAVAAFIELMANDILPSAIVSDWILNKPGTREYQFYKMVGRQLDNTARHLVDTVRKYDQRIPIFLFSKDEDLPDRYVKDNHLIILPKGEDPIMLVEILVDVVPEPDKLPDRTG